MVDQIHVKHKKTWKEIPDIIKQSLAAFFPKWALFAGAVL